MPPRECDLRALATEGAMRSEINVTPLVDVCLVLLIIFMVVTPLMRASVPVELPRTADPARLPEDGAQVTVTLRADGALFIGDGRVPAGELPDTLTRLRAHCPQARVLLSADEALSYREVRAALRTVYEAGFPRVGLLVRRREKP